MQKVNHKELASLLEIYYQSKLPLFIWGTFGIGKSRVVADTALSLAETKKREFVNWNKASASKKQEIFDNPGYNAGIAGGSASSCYRNLIGLHKKGMRIKRVFMLTPTYQRVEMFDKKWTPVAWWSYHHKAIKKTLLSDNYLLLEQQKSVDAVKGFCLANNIEHVIVDIDEQEIDHLLCSDKTARDFVHSGPDAHFKLSKVFYERYFQQYCSD